MGAVSQMEAMSRKFEAIEGVYSVTAPIEMTKTFVDNIQKFSYRKAFCP